VPTVVHFDLMADDTGRAKAFYEQLFNWKFQKYPGPVDYYLIETTDLEGKPSVGGGLGKRQAPGPGVTNYIGVTSVDEYAAKVEKLGGTIVQQKMEVPGFGWMIVCLDPEGNPLGLWQDMLKK
jgi:predicted enzyme related to lactoylglutathione lyase